MKKITCQFYMPDDNGKSIAIFSTVRVNAKNRKEAAQMAHLLCPYEAGRLVRFPRTIHGESKETLRLRLEKHHSRFPDYDHSKIQEQMAALNSVVE